MKKRIIFIFIIALVAVLLIANVVREEIQNNPENNRVNHSRGSSDNNPVSASSRGSSNNEAGITDNEKLGENQVNDNNSLINEPEESQPPQCLLVRPGNLPDITCSVNYIHEDGVSVNLKNELGQGMEVLMNLGRCGTASNLLANEENANFIFSCNSQSYFNEEIHITYIFGDDKEVNINGFVSGSISSN